MKKKTSIIIASFIFIATLVINFQSKNEQSKFSELTISTIKQAFTDPEYPHYGSYGRDYQNCSTTLHVSGSGTVTWHGISVDYTSSGDISLSCTNCAWDCNANGANNTCDPENC
jgi:hypothetical protein